MLELIRLPFTIIEVCFHGLGLLFDMVIHLAIERDYS